MKRTPKPTVKDTCDHYRCARTDVAPVVRGRPLGQWVIPMLCPDHQPQVQPARPKR